MWRLHPTFVWFSLLWTMFNLVTWGRTLFVPEPACRLVQAVQAGSETLRQERPVTLHLKSGESSTVALEASSGQFLQVGCSSKNLDVALNLYDPAGKLLCTVDGGEIGEPETVWFVAETKGTFRLEITVPQKEAVTGEVEIKLEEQRAAVPSDQDRCTAQKLFNAGQALRKQGLKETRQAAITKLETALTLFRQLEDRVWQGQILNLIGDLLYQLGERKKSVTYFEEALALKTALGDKRNQAILCQNLGVVYDGLGDKAKALEYYNRALLLARETENRAAERTTLSSLGTYYNSIGQGAKALEFHQQALTLAKELGSTKMQADSLNRIGRVLDNQGDVKKALEHYIRSLELYREAGDLSGQGTLNINLGAAVMKQGNLPKAREYFTTALELARKTGALNSQATALNNLGVSYALAGESQKALEYYRQVLPVQVALGDVREQAIVLTNIGTMFDNLSKKQEALETLQQALALRRSVSDKAGEGNTLSNLCTCYFSIGDYHKADEMCRQALAKREEAGDKFGQAHTLSSLGVLASSLDHDEEAIAFFNQSLTLRVALGDKPGQAITLSHMASCHTKAKAYPKALELARQSLDLCDKVGDKRTRAYTLNLMEEIQMGMEDFVQASETNRLSLAAWEQLEEPVGKAASLFHGAQIEAKFKHFETARQKIEASIALLEQIRTSLTGLGARTTHFSLVQRYYRFYVQLLMRMHQDNPTAGYAAEALQVSEKARARGLLDLLTEAQADIRSGVDPHLLEREQALQQLLKDKQERLTRLLVRPHTPQQEQEVKKEFDALLDEYNQVRARIRAVSPRYAALTQPQSLDVKRIQQEVLDPHTVLLEYVLDEPHSYVWVVSQTAVSVVELPHHQEIEVLALQLRELLTARNHSKKNETAAEATARIAKADEVYAVTAKKLSELLLAPVAGFIKGRRLLVVPDGPLQFVPFAALPEPGGPHPLVVGHEIITLPSASTLALLREERLSETQAKPSIAVLADPVYQNTDERVEGDRKTAVPTALTNPFSQQIRTRLLEREEESAATGTTEQVVKRRLLIGRLPFTKVEADAIFKLGATSTSLKAEGFDASRETVFKTDFSRFSYLHFATHGYVDGERPELSALVLSMVDRQGQGQDGFLRMTDIYNLNIPAELVVLSACETGLGKDVKGEGLVGLTRGFMYAGARRVVVSLWSVNDRATAALMTRFYQKMLSGKLRPAAALRAAQVEMIRQTQWKSPFYWGAFVLQGDYR
ncbi:MAG: CHAT domain-containing protein [Blastocatellia bacterium]|nr:CHAT domain-containing protein [Blastocatellia bacterium]